jgi:CheY-like chemotaxis protein/DNA-binding XRE family transcriptional regulator
MAPGKPKVNGFGELLKQLRLADNMTLSTFAAKLGISAANLCDFEQGRKIPSPKRALEFGKRLQLPDELMVELSLESTMKRDKIEYSVSVTRAAFAPHDSLPSGFEILVVEDSAKDVELTLRAFEKNGVGRAHIRVFRDGEGVLSYLLDRRLNRKRISTLPKVVLLDLKLPTIDGIEVLRQLKANPTTCAIPIVVLTSSAAESTLVESYQLGVNGYIVKPINFEKFSEAIGVLGKYWVQVNQTPEHRERSNAVKAGIRGEI